jgi:hypothetical protein
MSAAIATNQRERLTRLLRPANLGPHAASTITVLADHMTPPLSRRGPALTDPTISHPDSPVKTSDSTTDLVYPVIRRHPATA